jgi:hypothetical protein
MEGRILDLQVRVHGKAVREFQHDGKIYIEGRKGSEFTLRFRNKTGKRLLAVPSVDGLSVMDGENASFNSGGYILDPYEFMDVPGWRLDDESVAKFIFHKKGKSYAAKKGKPRNVGVIGVAAFLEKETSSFILRKCSLGNPSSSSFVGTATGTRLDSFLSHSGQTDGAPGETTWQFVKSGWKS